MRRERDESTSIGVTDAAPTRTNVVVTLAAIVVVDRRHEGGG